MKSVFEGFRRRRHHSHNDNSGIKNKEITMINNKITTIISNLEKNKTNLSLQIELGQLIKMNYYQLQGVNNGTIRAKILQNYIERIHNTTGIVGFIAEDTNYDAKNKHVSFVSEGSYTCSTNTENAKKHIFNNNSISSAIIMSGYQIVFYDGDNFDGLSYTLRGPAFIADMNSIGMNDKITTFVIETIRPTSQELESQVSQQKAIANRWMAESQMLTRKVNKSDAEINSQNKTISNLNNEYNSLQQQLNKKNEEYDALNQKLQETEESRDMLVDANADANIRTQVISRMMKENFTTMSDELRSSTMMSNVGLSVVVVLLGLSFVTLYRMKN